VLRARDTEALWEDHAPASGLRAVAPPSFERLVELAARNDDAPVLVTGETGTGKGYVVRRIHELSARATRRASRSTARRSPRSSSRASCSATRRARSPTPSRPSAACSRWPGRGSVFLDEIAELAPEVQPKLLKAIEERAFRRLGGTATLTSQARVLVATHVPLAAAVAAGRFRADLFYRLQVLTIALPPLRERAADIPALARSLLPARRDALRRRARRARRLPLAGQHPRAQERALAGHHPRRGRADRPAAPAPSERRRPPPRRPDGHAVLTLAAAEPAPSTAALAVHAGNKARAATCSGSPARRSTRSSVALPAAERRRERRDRVAGPAARGTPRPARPRYARVRCQARRNRSADARSVRKPDAAFTPELPILIALSRLAR
jgi:hypothetical protein